MSPDGRPQAGEGSSAGGSPPRCSHCSNVLGLYEPIILLVEGAPPQITSRALAPLPPHGVALHQDCFRQSHHRGAVVEP